LQSRAEFVAVPVAAAVAGQNAARREWVGAVAFSWGLCAYFPIGVMYLNLLLMLTALVFWPEMRSALRRLRRQPVLVPLMLLLAWTLLATAVGQWFPDTGTRLFHTFRVALVLCIGMMLTVRQARAAFAGFFVGSVLAATVVAVHHVWGLPDWALWSSLLTTRNNFSSGNMITMATAAGVCLVVGVGDRVSASIRWLLLSLFVALAATVAFHAISRNSQLVLLGISLLALLYRFRSVKAALSSVVVVSILAAATWQFSPNTSKRFVEMASDLRAVATAHNYSTSVGVRYRMYEEAVQGIVAHPLLGTGLGSWLPHWRTVWAELGPSQPPEMHEQFSAINNPHNDFLLTGMEIGLPGAMLLAWMMLRFLWDGWRARTNTGGIVMIFAASIIMTAMINAPFRDAALGMTLLWMLGVSMALRQDPAHA
jgi:O-antigen ligase